MSLAQRVRDFRYSKGWGPDELANRAAISRTALYQIESGKTELPRAGTLRRIAMALEVSMDTLLGHAEAAQARPTRPSAVGSQSPWVRGSTEWYPGEGAPISTPTPRLMPRYDAPEGPRFAPEFGATTVSGFESTGLTRERELTTKFLELLSSPLGDGMARIVEELHRIIPVAVAASPSQVSARGL